MTDNTIDVAAVHAAMFERHRVNSINIMDAVFVRDGKVLEVPQAERSEFKFTGLANVDFVASNVTLRESRRCE